MTIHSAMVDTMFNRVLERKRVTGIHDFAVITDKQEYHHISQVIPIFPEQLFFLDELVHQKIKDANVLEIGLGSGVLSIGAIKAGAAHVTGLEINPRAKNTAGFNIVLNGVEDRIAIVDGNEDIFQPVKGKKFDYIISNPPFEPTPPDQDYFYHSAAGPYGMDFNEKIFREVDEYLTDDGHLQIVTMAPGDHEKPFLLVDMAQKYLSGTTTILIDSFSTDYYEMIDWLPKLDLCTVAQAERLKEMARQDGISHSYLCVMHYEKGPKNVQVMQAKKVYGDPFLPLA